MRQARVWFAAALVVVGFVALCANGGIPSHGGEIRLLALLGGAVSVFTALTVWRTVRELAFERRLAAVSSPGDVGGFSVRWVEADAPFVAGLLWPAIYWPVDFAEGLTARERSSVLLHEEHHRRHRAPRRLLLLGVLQSTVPVPGIRAYVEWRRAQLEIDADQAALDAGATRSSLASALLKLSRAFLAAPSSSAAFTAAADHRIRSLLGDPACSTDVPAAGVSWALPAAIVLALATVCLFVVA